MITTTGTAIFADHVPAEVAVPVARLRESGAMLIGKTTTPAFGHKPLTEGVSFGRTLSPWDTSRTSGGSSDGMAKSLVGDIGSISPVGCIS